MAFRRDQRPGVAVRERLRGQGFVHSLRSAIGLRMTKSLNALCLTGGLAWRHEWLDSNASFTATGLNATIFGNGTGRDWAELTLGAQYTFANLTLSAGYYLFTNADNALHAGMGTLTWKF